MTPVPAVELLPPVPAGEPAPLVAPVAAVPEPELPPITEPPFVCPPVVPPSIASQSVTQSLRFKSSRLKRELQPQSTKASACAEARAPEPALRLEQK